MTAGDNFEELQKTKSPMHLKLFFDGRGSRQYIINSSGDYERIGDYKYYSTYSAD
jgi:hypothetical protein